MKWSDAHVAAYRKAMADSGRLDSLTDAELAAFAEDREYVPYVDQERLRRTAAAERAAERATELREKAALQLDREARRHSRADLVTFREGESFEAFAARNHDKNAPIGIVVAIADGLDRRLSATATLDRDRNRQISALARAIGIELPRPSLEERGAWVGDATFYPNDVVRSGGHDWRCLAKHRAADTNAPGSGGAANLWVELESDEPPASDGTTLFERLAAVERALGITPPECR